MIVINARFDLMDDWKECGMRDCETALDAVLQEIKEAPKDTKDALNIYATDGETTTVSALMAEGGYIIFVYEFGHERSFYFQP